MRRLHQSFTQNRTVQNGLSSSSTRPISSVEASDLMLGLGHERQKKFGTLCVQTNVWKRIDFFLNITLKLREVMVEMECLILLVSKPQEKFMIAPIYNFIINDRNVTKSPHNVIR